MFDEGHVHPAIRERIAGYGADILGEVKAAIAANDIVGMKQNPFPARRESLSSSAAPMHWRNGSRSGTDGAAPEGAPMTAAHACSIRRAPSRGPQ
jgi:hypothetical protein